MKIIHFIHGLNTGGAETLVKEYALNFDKKNSIILLCLHHIPESPYEKILLKNNIRIIFIEDYLPFKKPNAFIKKTINYLSRFLLVKKIIREEDADVLHTHLALNPYVKFAKPRKYTKIFYTVHNEPKKLWSNTKKDKRDFRAAKWLVKKYNMRFIVLHKKMQDEVNKLFNVNNSIILNNGIDTLQFKKTKKHNNEKNRLNIPNDAYIIGHIGRFSAQKNHEFIVKIFERIVKKKSNAFLLLIGDGTEKDKIENLLNDLDFNDKYIILSNRDDIPELLNIMDIFVFPSEYEGLGIALIEAQEAKLPCFVSDSIPDHAIISNLVTKLSLNNSADCWAEKILGYKYPERIILDDANWDIKQITKKLENIYSEALSGDKNGKK